MKPLSPNRPGAASIDVGFKGRSAIVTAATSIGSKKIGTQCLFVNKIFLFFGLLTVSLLSAAFRIRAEGTLGSWRLRSSRCAIRVREVAERVSVSFIRRKKIGDDLRFLVGNTHISHSGPRCELGGIGDEFGQVLPRPEDFRI